MKVKQGHHLKYIISNPTKNNSRQEANALMRHLHPEIDWHIHCVHHVDGNPMNNALVNLRIMEKSEHTKMHNTKKQPIIIFRLNKKEATK